MQHSNRMNILYFDLNEKSLIENYSVGNTSKYGAGGTVVKHLLNDRNDVYLAARKECFEGIPENKLNQCIILSESEIGQIRTGVSLIQIKSIPNELLINIDLIFHHFTNIHINTDDLKCETAVWAVGRGDFIHTYNKNLLLYSRRYQEPIAYHRDCNIFDVIIGRDIEPFKEYKKQDYIFQCSRNNHIFRSDIVAKWCIENKIRGIFAGPMEPSSNLLKYIDNRYTTYLGLIPEKVKQFYTKHARLYTLLYDWGAPFSISMIESLNYGTPVMTTKRGFTTSVIKECDNGFFYYDDNSLSYAWEKSPKLDQQEIYNSSLKYSKGKMIESFESAFENIIK